MTEILTLTLRRIRAPAGRVCREMASGVDLAKARGFLVTMARASGGKETGMLDTHPAGPERIASWDRAVEEIRASAGRLPERA